MPGPSMRADLDGDGDMDVLSASAATTSGDRLVREHRLAKALLAHSRSLPLAAEAYDVYAADIDGDGDMDVLSASH